MQPPASTEVKQAECGESESLLRFVDMKFKKTLLTLLDHGGP